MNGLMMNASVDPFYKHAGDDSAAAARVNGDKRDGMNGRENLCIFFVCCSEEC